MFDDNTQKIGILHKKKTMDKSLNNQNYESVVQNLNTFESRREPRNKSYRPESFDINVASNNPIHSINSVQKRRGVSTQNNHRSTNSHTYTQNNMVINPNVSQNNATYLRNVISHTAGYDSKQSKSVTKNYNTTNYIKVNNTNENVSVGRKIESPSAMQYVELQRYSNTHHGNRNYSPLNVSYNNNSQVIDYGHNNHNSNINAVQKNVLLTNVKKSDRSFSYNNPGYLINDKHGAN